MINLALCTPSLAVDPFTQGCASYTSADYATAKTQLLAAAKAQPKSWQVQYQLGNTFLQLKDLVDAKQAYEKCLTLKPDSEAKSRCESAIAYISNPPAPVPVKPAPIQLQVFSGSMLNGASRTTSASTPATSTVGTPVAASTTSSASPADDSRQQAIEAHRKHIISEAEERAAAVREEGKRAVVEADASSNYWWIDRENGGLRTGAKEEDKAAIMREYEKKANNILKEAKKRASEITTP